MERWINVASWLKKKEIMETKKLKPFQRFDVVRLNVGLTSYEKFIFFVIFVCIVIQIIYGVLMLCGISL